MKKQIVLILVLALSAFSVACGGDDSESTSTDTSSTDAGYGMITFDNTITMTDWVTTQPLEGVNLCINVDGVDCAVTDADGEANFKGEVAPGTAVQLTGEKDDYFPFLAENLIVDPIGTATASYFMAKEDIVAAVTAALGEGAAPDKGHLGVAVWGPVNDGGTREPLAGAAVELVTGTAAYGPKYYNLISEIGNGIFAEDATATTAAGLSGFFNMDPAVVSVTVTAPGHDCVTIFNGLPVDGATLQTTVQAGRVTYGAVFCDAVE